MLSLKKFRHIDIYTRKYFALLVSIKPDGMGCDSLKHECRIEFYALEFAFCDFYRLESIDFKLEQAAQTLGASP